MNCCWLVIHQGRHPGGHARYLPLCRHNFTSHLLKIPMYKCSLVTAHRSCVPSITGHPGVVRPFGAGRGTENSQLFMKTTGELDVSARGKWWDGSSQTGKGGLEQSTAVNLACCRL